MDFHKVANEVLLRVEVRVRLAILWSPLRSLLHQTRTAIGSSRVRIRVRPTFGNSLDKLRHIRSVAYSVEFVLLNKHYISGGGAYLDRYPTYW